MEQVEERVCQRLDELMLGHGGGVWAGGLGTSSGHDPTSEDPIVAVLTPNAFTGPFASPAAVRDVWTGTYATLDRGGRR